MVPNLFGTRDRSHGRQVFHGLGAGGAGDGSGGNASDGERSPATHHLLCGPVPNRPRTATSLQPRDWGPLDQRTQEPLVKTINPAPHPRPPNTADVSTGFSGLALSSLFLALVLPLSDRYTLPQNYRLVPKYSED